MADGKGNGKARRGGARETFSGVSRANDRFAAAIVVKGRRVTLGSWKRELDAAVAFDRAVLWYGLDLSLNMPSESRALGPCSPALLRRQALSQNQPAGRRPSAFQGVASRCSNQAWQIYLRGETPIGSFASEKDAAIAYDRIMRGSGAGRDVLNFPDEDLPPATVAEIRAEVERRRKSERTSQFRGVSRKRDGWQVEVTVAGQRLTAGTWPTEQEAAEAHDRAALFFHGKGAPRNLPGRPLAPTSPEDLRAELRALRKAKMTSKYHGVIRVVRVHAREKRLFRAIIRMGGASRAIVEVEDERDAAIAYDRVARHLHGEAALLNFPEEPHPATSLAAMRAEQRGRRKAVTTSRYVGVCWDASGAAWDVRLVVRRAVYTFGSFDDEAAAARKYDRAAWDLRGTGPYNFPEEVASFGPQEPERWRSHKRKRPARSDRRSR